jgi:hypothetical protein
MKTKNLFFTIITMISMNMAFAQPGTIDIIVNSPEIKFPEEVTITGSVKNEDGMPLSNAKVRTIFNEEYFTDSNGVFSFTLEKEEVTPQSIFVSYNGLMTAVRSYHPVMANTDYNIILHKPAECCCVITNHCIGADMDPATVYFKNNSVALSGETKKQLDVIAGRLKECPAVIVLLTAHPSYRKSIQKFADLRLDAIKEYFIEQDGISTDRIKTSKTTDEESSNSVDVRPE